MTAVRRSRPLRSLLRRPSSDRRLLVQALAVLTCIRLALWVLPSRTLLRLVAARVPQAQDEGMTDLAAAGRVGWAVRKAARHVPRSTCVTEALAAQLLLADRDLPSQLCIGVARDDDGGVEAHAWVEVDGRVVVGNGALHRFARLPDLGSALLLK